MHVRLAKRSKSTFRIDCIRALLATLFASALGLCANAFSAKSLPLWPAPEPATPMPPIPVSPSLDAAAPKAPVVKPKTITIPELAAALQSNASLLLLDVRSKYDFDAGHVPKAMNVPGEELPQQAAQLSELFHSVETLVTMCDGEGCDKAAHAAKQLREMGYTDVRVLKGGWEAYLQAKLDVQETPR
jgi:rhodanese-related sulfurtransferase